MLNFGGVTSYSMNFLGWIICQMFSQRLSFKLPERSRSSRWTVNRCFWLWPWEETPRIGRNFSICPKNPLGDPPKKRGLEPVFCRVLESPNHQWLEIPWFLGWGFIYDKIKTAFLWAAGLSSYDRFFSLSQKQWLFFLSSQLLAILGKIEGLDSDGWSGVGFFRGWNSWRAEKLIIHLLKTTTRWFQTFLFSPLGKSSTLTIIFFSWVVQVKGCLLPHRTATHPFRNLYQQAIKDSFHSGRCRGIAWVGCAISGCGWDVLWQPQTSDSFRRSWPMRPGVMGSDGGKRHENYAETLVWR